MQMFQIDIMSRTPVYEQLVSQLERLVLAGLMKQGEQLPSIRSLSLELAINPNTIQKAYAELDRRGLTHSVPGRGCFIAEDVEQILNQRGYKKLESLRELVKELKMAGIDKEEIIKIINEIYREEGA